MKIVFMGTPDFAVPALLELINSKHEVAAVFTQPDKPVGRKQVLTPPPVKITAQKHGIPVYQPATLKTGEAYEVLSGINPDVIVVIAFGKILPKNILELPRLGCVNVHGSVLPLYRGAAPIQQAVLDGRKETGITTMLMNEGLDTGDVLEVLKTEIDINETSGELFDRLSHMGSKLLLSTLEKLENGETVPVPQDESLATYTKVLDKSICEIDWSRPALEVHNKIRGLNPWPVAVSEFSEKKVKVYKSELTGETAEPGTVACTKNGFSVACGDGKMIRIIEIQPIGKSRMSAAAFLCGCQDGIDSVYCEI